MSPLSTGKKVIEPVMRLSLGGVVGAVYIVFLDVYTFTMHQEQTMSTNETPPPLELTPPPDGKTRWGQERRLAFIDFRLQFERRLNRKDLRDFFGISAQQASLDLAAYAGLAPNLLRYDAKAKVYVPGEAFQPHYGCEDAGLYLKDILALGTDIIRRDASFIGWLPEFGIVPTLKRPLAASLLAEVLAAMRERRCLQLSVDEPE
jgi:hypothetical protein